MYKMQLTDREKAVCAYMMQGDPNKMIAKKIGVDEKSAGMVIKRLKDKFEAPDKTSLIVTLLKKQIITLDHE